MTPIRTGGRIAPRRKAGRPVRVLASAAAVAVGLVMVAGCQIPGFNSSAPAPTAKGIITVAATPGVADAPLYIAYTQGMFRHAGLSVRIINYTSTNAELAALQAGKVEVAFADYADMFYAQAKALSSKKKKNGLNMVVVADGYDAAPNTMEVLTLPKSGIVTPKNLEHKSIGTTQPQLMPPPGTPGVAAGAPYTLETVATQSVLTNDNVAPSTISWRPLPPAAPASLLIGELAAHKVSAILATEPTIFDAESELGAVPVLDSSTGDTANLPLDGYFALRSYSTSNHAALVAFRGALEKGQAEAAQSAVVRATLQGSVGMSVQDSSLVTLGVYPTATSASALQRVVSLMFTFNSIPSVDSNQLSVQSMIFK
jgi:NitT/TauT family transport system substrate-binding protein